MQHKDYSRKEILYEAFIDIMFLPNEKQEYSEINVIKLITNCPKWLDSFYEV